MAYAEKRAANPGALGLTIGLNLAAVAALAAWNPSFVKEVMTVIPLIKIRPDDPIPPPLPNDPQPKQQQQIDQPKRTVETTGPIDTGFVHDPDPIILGPPGGIDIIKIDPPQPPIRDIIRHGAGLATSPENLQPPYPPGLQRQEIQGNVTVRVRVGTDGRPLEIALVRADNPDFFAAAQSWGMRHWRFKPATEDGSPVESWFNLTVRFTIQ